MQKSAVSYSYHVKQGTDQIYGPVVLGQVAPNRNSTLASTCIPLTREKKPLCTRQSFYGRKSRCMEKKLNRAKFKQ